MEPMIEYVAVTVAIITVGTTNAVVRMRHREDHRTTQEAERLLELFVDKAQTPGATEEERLNASFYTAEILAILRSHQSEFRFHRRTP